MALQFVREPLRAEEADRLANACRSPEEKLVVWTLLDSGLRVSELCSLTRDNVQWQQRSLRVTGKAGPHGSRRKQRIVPLSARVRAILKPYFALNDAWFVGASGPEDRQADREPRPARPRGHPACAPPYLGNPGTSKGDLPGRRAEDPRPRSPDDHSDLLESHRRPCSRGVRSEMVREPCPPFTRPPIPV